MPAVPTREQPIWWLCTLVSSSMRKARVTKKLCCRDWAPYYLPAWVEGSCLIHLVPPAHSIMSLYSRHSLDERWKNGVCLYFLEGTPPFLRLFSGHSSLEPFPGDSAVQGRLGSVSRSSCPPRRTLGQLLHHELEDRGRAQGMGNFHQVFQGEIGVPRVSQAVDPWADFRK